MLTRAEVNFCNERLVNQVELKFRFQFDFIGVIGVESVHYPKRKFNFSTSRGNPMRQRSDVSKINGPIIYLY